MKIYKVIKRIPKERTYSAYCILKGTRLIVKNFEGFPVYCTLFNRVVCDVDSKTAKEYIAIR